MKWCLSLLIIISTSVSARYRVDGICESNELVSCQREGEIEGIKDYLRRHPNRENITQIYERRNQILSESALLRRRAEAESMLFTDSECACHSFGAALSNLVSFIEKDFPEVTEQLLENIPTDEQAQRVKNDSIFACGHQMRNKRSELFAHARAAYEANQSQAALTLGVTRVVTGRGLRTDLRFYQAETADRELIFSFAGTQTADDWGSNIVHSGADQLREAVDSPAFMNAVNHVKGGGKINCTGHSLGGGLAEGFCLSVLARVKQDRPNFGFSRRDNLIQITTFNALGARGMCMNPRMTRNRPENTLLAIGQSTLNSMTSNLDQSLCGTPSSRDWAVSSADHIRIRGDFIPQTTPELISSYMAGNVTRLESDLQMRRALPQNMSVRPEVIFESVSSTRASGPLLTVQYGQDRCDNDPVNAHSLECIAHAIAPVSRPGALERCENLDSEKAGWVQVPANDSRLSRNRPQSSDLMM